MDQQTLDFDGRTYSQDRDGARLTSQFGKLMALMLDGEYRTLRQIAEKIGDSEAGASARLRDARKIKFGGYNVNRRHVSGGLYEYQVTK